MPSAYCTFPSCLTYWPMFAVEWSLWLEKIWSCLRPGQSLEAVFTWTKLWFRKFDRNQFLSKASCHTVAVPVDPAAVCNSRVISPRGLMVWSASESRVTRNPKDSGATQCAQRPGPCVSGKWMKMVELWEETLWDPLAKSSKEQDALRLS